MLSTIPESTTDDESEDIDNPVQLKMSQDMEKRKKPHIQALDELLKNETKFRYKD